METISHREENMPSSRPIAGIFAPGSPNMSPMGSLKKCLFRKGEIEMKRYLSDTVSNRSDFQGEEMIFMADHILVGMCRLWGGR